MDSHNIQRYVDSTGHVRNEGDVQVGGFPPYKIAYRSIRPKQRQCENLLVPTCLSASHIAYGSIRMEPVFMVLGQSAATAACQAIARGCAVQEINVAALQDRLRADGQVLQWTSPTNRQGIARSSLRGTVLDDGDADLVGDWTISHATPGFIETGYRHDGNAGKGTKSATFTPVIDRPGEYAVRLAYTAHPNRATNVRVTVHDATSTRILVLDQTQAPSHGALHQIGKFSCTKGKGLRVEISTAGTDGYVIIDAAQFVRTQ
jgi:hypothetical protein